MRLIIANINDIEISNDNAPQYDHVDKLMIKMIKGKIKSMIKMTTL